MPSPGSSPGMTTKFMADRQNSYKQNVTGVFFVDDQCIDCSLCSELAPKHFKRTTEDGGHDYVYNQPVTKEEIANCNEAKDSCPVDAIGN